MNVAVITDVPALPKSNWPAETVTTDVVADEYVHVPVAAVVATVGAVIVAFASPYVADTFDHVNVGVALSTVKVAVTDAVLKFAVSAGVNVAVIVDEPAPAIVAVAPLKSATDVSADVYDQVPDTALPPNVAVGSLNENAGSPNVFVGTLSAPSVSVARETVTVIVTVPPET